MVSKKELNQFLDTREQTSLQQFADNEIMRGAVEKVLLYSAHNAGTLRKGKTIDQLNNFALNIACQKGATNEEIGADVKACWEAMNEIGVAFKRIDMFKKEEVLPDKVNPAR